MTATEVKELRELARATLLSLHSIGDGDWTPQDGMCYKLAAAVMQATKEESGDTWVPRLDPYAIGRRLMANRVDQEVIGAGILSRGNGERLKPSP